MNYFIEICQSLLANLLTPIILFIIAYYLRRLNPFVTFVSRVYNEVKNRYLIYIELDEASGTSDDKSSEDKEEIHNNHSDENILPKISKDYGKDGNWKVRTFYTINRKQLNDFDYIEFSIREMEIKIKLSTKDLLDNFIKKGHEDDVVDGSNSIRIFIFQKSDSKEFFLVRFGRKPFSTPRLLQKDENGIYKINN
ncbi:hypothetical protein [Apilactobacillus kunkeei]|uniref:hypothetical protein n=1 Tax=Apilactobacillus kunkeei TaxID=148814 RepID=UPI0006CE6741|nr:hypothetical protein [Apilactobacillus kunkeei]KPN81106.1 hypothetical protein RZ77_01230 [Apilactobacillus kunkeei]TPR54027.1 hypothetical protein DY036_04240 [Apilactobacillus kunkeei]